MIFLLSALSKNIFRYVSKHIMPMKTFKEQKHSIKFSKYTM